MSGARDRFDAIGVVVDWIDACKQRRLDDLLNLYDAMATVECCEGFTEYWVGPGAYGAMDARQREAVRASIAKLPVEWPTGFEPYGATVEALSGFNMPIQLIGGSRTTPAARAVTDVLRGLWPKAAYAEIEGAGHMGPVTHADTVSEIVDTFIGGVTGSIFTTGV